jgi:hypothetical protein
MALRRSPGQWRDRRARHLYQRYGVRPWHLLEERTREHYRQLVVAGVYGAGRPLPRRLFRLRATGIPAADH